MDHQGGLILSCFNLTSFSGRLKLEKISLFKQDKKVSVLVKTAGRQNGVATVVSTYKLGS